MKITNCFRNFVKYTSLSVLGMLGVSCYILADTFFVSKGIGANGLTALNLAIPVYSFIHGSGLMLGMGGATRYSVAKSQNDISAANRIYTNTIFLWFGLAVIFFITGVFFSGGLIRLLGADEVIFEIGKIYLKVILLFSPMFMLNNILLCFVRNDGSPQLSMLAMLGGSFSNIILDYIFMFHLKMGIFGAALATGLAPIISMIILSSFFFRKKDRFHLIKCKFSANISMKVFSSGVPSFITELSSGIVIIVFNIIILGLQGNVGVAAYGVIANLSLVVISIYTGIAQGIQPLLSCYHGTRDYATVQSLLRYALVTMLLVSGLIYFIIFFGASQITSIFNSEQNAVLQNIAVTGLKIYFAACIFAGFNIIMSIYFTSTEYARPAHIISVLRGFIIIIPMAFLLSFIGGIKGVWCVFPATELMVAVIGSILYLRFRQIINLKRENH